VSRAGGPAFFTGVGAAKSEPKSSETGAADEGLEMDAEEGALGVAASIGVVALAFGASASGASSAAVGASLAANRAGSFALGAGAGLGGGGAPPALHITTLVAMASLILVLWASVIFSKYGFIGLSPKILDNAPRPSAAALRTGSRESPSCPTMAGAITSRSDLVGACFVVLSERARNCNVPCRAAGFLSCKAVVQSPVISENET